MKIGLGVALLIVALVILAAGRRSRAGLAIGLVILGFGGYLVFRGVRALRVNRVAAELVAAAKSGDLATVRRIVESDSGFVNASLRQDGAVVDTPLIAASRALHADVVGYLLSRGALVNADLDDGRTALHEAGETRALSDAKVMASRLATIKVLLDGGANVNARDGGNRTPLMSNARDAGAVALLIDRKADVNATDSYGRTALHYAGTSRFDHTGSVKVLLDRGAQVDVRDRSGETPLLVANNADDLEALLAHGANPKAVDSDGNSALHEAARSTQNLYSDLDMLAALCSAGLRPDTANRAGQTPLSLAKTALAGERDAGWMKGRRRVVRFLSPDGPCLRLAGAGEDQRKFAVAEIRCDEDDRFGCASLGWDYDTGRGTAVDKVRSVEFYEKACRLGSQASCANLAYDYDRGEGVAEDPARAATLYGNACDAGEMRACYNLGLLVAAGRGTSKDSQRAAALFRKACDGGYEDGCTHPR